MARDADTGTLDTGNCVSAGAKSLPFDEWTPAGNDPGHWPLTLKGLQRAGRDLCLKTVFAHSLQSGR